VLFPIAETITGHVLKAMGTWFTARRGFWLISITEWWSGTKRLLEIRDLKKKKEMTADPFANPHPRSVRWTAGKASPRLYFASIGRITFDWGQVWWRSGRGWWQAEGFPRIWSWLFPWDRDDGVLPLPHRFVCVLMTNIEDNIFLGLAMADSR